MEGGEWRVEGKGEGEGKGKGEGGGEGGETGGGVEVQQYDLVTRFVKTIPGRSIPDTHTDTDTDMVVVMVIVAVTITTLGWWGREWCPPPSPPPARIQKQLSIMGL